MYRNHSEAQAARIRRRQSRVPGAAALDAQVLHLLRERCDSRLRHYRSAAGQFGIYAHDISRAIYGTYDERVLKAGRQSQAAQTARACVLRTGAPS